MRAELAMVTVTPGSTAFEVSLTLPLTAPVVELVVCANAGAGAAQSQMHSKETRHADAKRTMLPSLTEEPCDNGKG
jgi:hypothetical protein